MATPTAIKAGNLLAALLDASSGIGVVASWVITDIATLQVAVVSWVITDMATLQAAVASWVITDIATPQAAVAS